MKDMAFALDPLLWAQKSFDFEFDPWQGQALRSSAKRSIWNIHRQGGKSSIAALKGLHRAVYRPGSLVLMISPSLRQSGELFRKFISSYDSLESRPEMVEDTKLSCQFDNHSRAVSLPGVEDTVRGFTANLIIEDESARCSDELYAALRPMLAVSQGDLILMSTPKKGKKGHFYETWINGGPRWDKVKVTAEQCPRITKEFLEDELAALGPIMFAIEYGCEFIEDEFSLFDDIRIGKAIDDSIEEISMEDY
jgi:hypothetical protein